MIDHYMQINKEATGENIKSSWKKKVFLYLKYQNFFPYPVNRPFTAGLEVKPFPIPKTVTIWRCFWV